MIGEFQIADAVPSLGCLPGMLGEVDGPEGRFELSE
jgi:hypothetical protein